MFITMVVLFSGEVFTLISCISLIETTFIALSISAMMYMRKKHPEWKRPIKVDSKTPAPPSPSPLLFSHSLYLPLSLLSLPSTSKFSTITATISTWESTHLRSVWIIPITSLLDDRNTCSSISTMLPILIGASTYLPGYLHAYTPISSTYLP